MSAGERAPRRAPRGRLHAPITLDQLRVFVEVVESGSFSRAAKRLRRVQSAVSYAIANLERLLEARLFERSGRAPALTDAGHRLLPDARAVLGRADALFERARAGEAERSLRVATSPGPAAARLLRALAEMAAEGDPLEVALVSRGEAPAGQLEAGAAELVVHAAAQPTALGAHRVELPGAPALVAVHYGSLSPAARRLLERMS